MMIIDLTNELAPLLWTMEGLMLVAVAWLVGMFFSEQVRPPDFRKRSSNATPEPRPTLTSSEDHDRMAA